MGSLLLSSDLLVSLYLNPLAKAFSYKDYRTACTFLYAFNEFFKGFKMGIDNLPRPIDPDPGDISSRRNPNQYYMKYFELYYPLVSKILGVYQSLILQHIKDEKGA